MARCTTLGPLPCIEGIDVVRLAAVARRHRVEGLVAHGLRQTGLDVPAEIEQAAFDRAAAALRIAADAQRIGALFKAAGIDWIVVKGPPLAALAYGNAALKMSRDLDLLVAPGDVVGACRLLSVAGYRRVVPGPEVSDARLPVWLRYHKDIGWSHHASGVLVELHARLFDNPALLPQIGTSSPRQEVEVAPGVRLPTLAREPLQLYLAVHGAVSGWARLKWLADWAAIVDDPERSYRAAVAAGVGRCAGQGLLLAEELLDLELPPRLSDELGQDRTVKRLVAVARRLLVGPSELREVDWESRDPLALELSHFLLRRGAGFKLTELRHKIANPGDRARGALPGALGFLYPALGGLRYARRRLRR